MIIKGRNFHVCFQKHLFLFLETTYFCILVLYHATFLGSFFIIAYRFLVQSLGFSIHNMSRVKRDSFNSSFLIWMPFIYFSCWVALTRTSSTMLNRSDENGHTCLISQKAFRFSLLSMMLTVGFSCMTFIMLRYIPSMGLP